MANARGRGESKHGFLQGGQHVDFRSKICDWGVSLVYPDGLRNERGDFGNGGGREGGFCETNLSFDALEGCLGLGGG